MRVPGVLRAPLVFCGAMNYILLKCYLFAWLLSFVHPLILSSRRAGPETLFPIGGTHSPSCPTLLIKVSKQAKNIEKYEKCCILRLLHVLLLMDI